MLFNWVTFIILLCHSLVFSRVNGFKKQDDKGYPIQENTKLNTHKLYEYKYHAQYHIDEYTLHKLVHYIFFLILLHYVLCFYFKTLEYTSKLLQHTPSINFNVAYYFVFTNNNYKFYNNFIPTVCAERPHLFYSFC